MTNGGGASTRLFFAVWPDAAAGRGSVAAADALQLEVTATPVSAESHHMTLAFLGEVPTSALPTIKDIAGSIVLPGFNIRFDAYEYWPKPEVVVAAARGVPPSLTTLWQELHVLLARHQWGRDAKRLRPHVTLARKVMQEPVLQRMSPFDWHVETFSLVRSDTGGKHSSYTVVDTWPLLDKREKP